MNVPNMGDSISEGTIVELCFKNGDYVNVDDIVAIIETDKVSIDVRASSAGVIEGYHCGVDDTVEVGAKLVSIDSDGKAPAGGSAKPVGETAAPTPKPAPSPEKDAVQTPKAPQAAKSPAPAKPTPTSSPALPVGARTG